MAVAVVQRFVQEELVELVVQTLLHPLVTHGDQERCYPSDFRWLPFSFIFCADCSDDVVTFEGTKISLPIAA